MTTWITGANGFIGRHLIRELANRGRVVHGVGHGAIDPDSANALGLQVWINGEVDAANLSRLASTNGVPRQVFHLAGGSSVGPSIERPFEDFSRTVACTARLLEWLRSFAPTASVVVVSSAAVYGGNHAGPISEDTNLDPVSPYGQHKLMMELLCRSYAKSYRIRCAIVRLFSVFGPHLRKQLIWDICSRLQGREPTILLGGTGAEVRDWTDVRDVARLLVHVGDLPSQETPLVVNGGSGRGTDVATVAQLIVKSLGSDAVVRYSGIERAGDPFSLVADSRRLEHLNFKCRISLEEGIYDYVRWFKQSHRN